MRRLFTYDRLAEACLDNDSLAREHQIDHMRILDRMGQDPDEIKRIAEQRGLRLVIALRGDTERKRMTQQVYDKQWSIEDLTEDETELLAQLAAMWIDGFVALLRASRA